MDDTELRLLAATQGHVFRRDQARHVTRSALRSRLKTGRWVALRRGVYVESSVLASVEFDPLRRMALDLAAWRLSSTSRTAASHQSAAQIHGVALLEPIPEVPRLTSSRGSVRRQSDLWVNVAQLPDSHLTTVNGLELTSVARTVIDLSRERGFVDGVVAADSALYQRRCTADELWDTMTDCLDWPGARAAQDVLVFADGRAESPHESLCRVACHEGELPPPTPQLWIPDERGFLFARADLGWEAQRTLLEADGLVKYAIPEEGGPNPLALEKIRQLKLEDLGWEVVRALWQESRFDRPAIVAKVERAFRIQARRAA